MTTYNLTYKFNTYNKMKRIITAAAVVLGVVAAFGQGYPITPVEFTRVSEVGDFWGRRLKSHREVTLPLALAKCDESGRYENFRRAAAPCDTFSVGGFPFDDTDVYKTVEGASYSLLTRHDPKLEAYLDSVLDIVAAAQEPDGYLNTSRTMNPAKPHSWMGPERWSKVEDLSHELYNLGHMAEGAVAHWRATGSRKFLDIACRYADCVVRTIGPAADQLHLVPGHQIAEMALAKLYLATGERKYLDQAKYFLDMRGRTARRDAYSQAHQPVTEQREAVGHAVRAAYMYAGMADVAALTGDAAYIAAVDSIWHNIVDKKLYLTGGIGARHQGESFGDNYELPNTSAYCETCASIGNVYVNHRLFLLHGDAKYYDVLERTLYNGLIAGMSIDGGKFFYPNPLASDGGYERQAWFGCACCPSNLSRFIPSLPGYAYAVHDGRVYVNLYMTSKVDIDVADNRVSLTQTTGYPYNGGVHIEVAPERAGRFELALRIPLWARNAPLPSDLYTYVDGRANSFSASVNGTPVQARVDDKGYLTIDREWKAGDRVELNFDMQPRVVMAHEAVEADRGLLAVERGPIVYCAEEADNGPDIAALTLGVDDVITPEALPDTLGGIVRLNVKAADGGSGVTLIPYYAWCNRGAGKMAVWLKRR